MSGAKIAKLLKIPRSTVYTILSKFKQTLTIDRKKGSGKKRSFKDKKKVRDVIRSLSTNSGLSNRDRAKKYGCSEFLIRKIKKRHGYKSYHRLKVPHRSEKQNLIAKKRARILYKLLCAKKNGCLCMDDETYCKLDFRQLPGQSYYTSKISGNVHPRYKYIMTEKFAKKVMIWQAICSCGKVSKPLFTNSTMKAENYIKDCLKARLLPLFRQHHEPVLFWPDLASCHVRRQISWKPMASISSWSTRIHQIVLSSVRLKNFGELSKQNWRRYPSEFKLSNQLRIIGTE